MVCEVPGIAAYQGTQMVRGASDKAGVGCLAGSFLSSLTGLELKMQPTSTLSSAALFGISFFGLICVLIFGMCLVMSGNSLKTQNRVRLSLEEHDVIVP